MPFIFDGIQRRAIDEDLETGIDTQVDMSLLHVGGNEIKYQRDGLYLIMSQTFEIYISFEPFSIFLLYLT